MNISDEAKMKALDDFNVKLAFEEQRLSYYKTNRAKTMDKLAQLEESQKTLKDTAERQSALIAESERLIAKLQEEWRALKG